MDAAADAWETLYRQLIVKRCAERRAIAKKRAGAMCSGPWRVVPQQPSEMECCLNKDSP